MTDRRLITVDFASVTGRIKPLHGMCNGPLSPGTDLSDLFMQMGVSCVRFADALPDFRQRGPQMEDDLHRRLQRPVQLVVLHRRNDRTALKAVFQFLQIHLLPP